MKEKNQCVKLATQLFQFDMCHSALKNPHDKEGLPVHFLNVINSSKRKDFCTMKTASLLLAVATLGHISSAAQIYSVNALGYLDMSLSSGLCMIANPFNQTNNQLDTILPLPDSAAGTALFRFNRPTQSYYEPISWVDGYGWFTADPDPGIMVLNPWDGAFIDVAGPTPLKISFVGELPLRQCQLLGGNRLSIISNPYGGKLPQAWRFIDGDTILVFDCDSKSYKDPYQFIDGFGWFSNNPDDPGPEGPTLAIGQSAWFWGASPSPRCFLEDPIEANPAATALILTHPARSGTSFSFKFLAEDSVAYQAQTASSFAGPWRNILTPLTGPAGGGMVAVTHTNADSYGLYRLARELP